MNTKFIWSILALQILFLQDLYCYIDPGLGSMIFQILIAGSVTVIYFIKIFWKQIKLFSSRWIKQPIKNILKRKK